MRSPDETPHWLCVDRPNKTRILHYAEGCRWSRSIASSGAIGPLKPVGSMGKNGGWMLFATRKAAEVFAQSEFPTFQEIHLCSQCRFPELSLETPLANDVDAPAEREEATVYRLLRDTALARWVKMKHGYRCQLCGHTIQLPDGSLYAEAHHIQPLGGQHRGPDTIQNIVCVCPNHHAELDYFAIALTHETLRLHPDHPIAQKHVDYHNTEHANRRNGGEH